MKKAMEQKIVGQYSEAMSRFESGLESGYYNSKEDYNSLSDGMIFQSDLIDQAIDSLYEATLISYEDAEELRGINEDLREQYEDMIFDSLAA